MFKSMLEERDSNVRKRTPKLSTTNLMMLGGGALAVAGKRKRYSHLHQDRSKLDKIYTIKRVDIFTHSLKNYFGRALNQLRKFY